MVNSKLIGLLRSLSPRELRDLKELAGTPYFNTNRDVSRLLHWLDGLAPGFNEASRAEAHASLFPGEPPDEARLNHLMSFLLKLAEEYVGLEHYRKDALRSGYYVLKGLETRGLEKHYHFNLEKMRRLIDGESRPGPQIFYETYALELYESEHFDRNSPRQFNNSVQKAADALDTFYLLEKLRCTCYMLTSQAILATPYNLQLVDEICRFTGKHLDRIGTPAIEAYYRIFQLLTKEKADEDFNALKILLRTRAQEFGVESLKESYQYAINHCNLQIMKMRENYIEEAFDLYSECIRLGLLLEGGVMSPWHFKNIINLSLKLKKYDWTEQFIRENTRLLAPEFQGDALHYNLSLLYYSTGRLSEAQIHLNKVEFTDIHYSTGAKVMLCQIFYQNGNYDALDSLLHAFNTFLRRNKLISEDVRWAYLNFIKVMQKILRCRPQQYPSIMVEVDKMRVLAGRDWLLNILKG